MRTVVIGLVVILCYHLHAQNPIVIPKTNGTLVLDGQLTEPFWFEIEPLRFSEYRPNAGVTDSLTTMYVTYDTDNLIIGFIAKDAAPDQIISRCLLRDKWYGDDYVSFHIDPNDTDQNGFVFSVYPPGSRFDMAVSNDAVPLGNSTFNVSYDMIWDAKVHRDEEGWSAELKIPISNLRFKRDSDGNIIAAISGLRSQNYLGKSTTFPEVPQEVTNAIEKPSLKYPVIFQELTPKKQLQITPYVTASLGNRYALNSEETSYTKTNTDELDAGLDIRYGISPSLTLDVTVNTDFSQVEIDDQIVNVNDRVNIFLPEKRKFFQEQAGLFDFNAGIFSQLFYSRQIGINNGQLTPILGGVRLTGQVGNTDIGLLSLQTEGIRLSETNSIASENFSVLRLRRSIINNKSFIGFMATNRLRKGYYNTAIGFDNVISLPNDVFLVSSASTSIDKDNPDYSFIDNSRFSVYLDKRKESGWYYRAAYEFSGEDYNPAMGFLLRERHHNMYGALTYGTFNTDKTKHIFQYQRFTLFNSDTYTDTDFSKVITWYNRSFWRGRLFSGDSFILFAQAQYENVNSEITLDTNLFVPEGQYDFYYFGASYSPAVQHKVKIPIGIEYGSYFDGTNFRFNLNPEFNFGKHLTIQSSYRANRIRFKRRNQKEWIHIAQTKFNLAYNLHLSGSIIGQYNSLSDQILTSARLRYNFKDGHDLYLVYNQDYNLDAHLFTPQLPRYNNQIITVKYLYTFSK
ncbi:DUF5916 domain-containing protein [Winogradskyella sp. 3972H.M.0a.05]|uniref:DUF5916 domain-containing protein n=1 Tax=Winogradskyella sp. 3972H.M.0a.05 TaxID=2950277 RepID=UPI003394C953